MNVYNELANAIIVQAANDYRSALQQLKRNPRYNDAIVIKQECESFFRSQWFQTLTKIDGITLLQKLQEEVY